MANIGRRLLRHKSKESSGRRKNNKIIRKRSRLAFLLKNQNKKHVLPDTVSAAQNLAGPKEQYQMTCGQVVVVVAARRSGRNRFT
jgi:hypothetical protein